MIPWPVCLIEIRGNDVHQSEHILNSVDWTTGLVFKRKFNHKNSIITERLVCTMLKLGGQLKVIAGLPKSYEVKLVQNLKKYL